MILLYGFLFGIGFGFFVQRAGFCISQGIASIMMGKPKRIMTMWLAVLIITTIGFYFLGLKPIGQIRGAGFFNILSGIVFGLGIALSGGCILGTLRQIGEGNMFYLIVLISFIPGMLLQTKIIDPILKDNYNIQKILIPEFFGNSILSVVIVVVVMSIIGICIVQKTRTK